MEKAPEGTKWIQGKQLQEMSRSALGWVQASSVSI